MGNRFWVIGGEFENTTFERVLEGTQKVIGPFSDHGEAKQAWEHLATETRSICNARFTIVREGAPA
jgi:hypothetical protein